MGNIGNIGWLSGLVSILKSLDDGDHSDGSDAETISDCGPSKKSIDSDMIYQTEFMDMMMIQEAICMDYETGIDETNLGGAEATNSEGAATVTLDDFDYANEWIYNDLLSVNWQNFWHETPTLNHVDLLDDLSQLCQYADDPRKLGRGAFFR